MIVVNKIPWFSARFINTELIVKLLINRGLRKVQSLRREELEKDDFEQEL